MKKRTREINNGIKTGMTQLIVLVILGVLMLFFVNDFYGASFINSLILSAIVLVISYSFWKQGFFHFFMFFSVTLFFFISLEVSFNLELLANFIISLVFGLSGAFSYKKFESRRNFALILLIAFVFIWIILAFNVKFREDWLLENYLTIPFVLVLLIVSRWFKFSKTSYCLIFAYMFLHAVGSHYTYSEVPFGYWLSNLFGLDRNHYDRIVHFSFGFLLAYPVREIFVRIGNYKGIWALFAPIIFVFGLSSVYELLEWGAAVYYGGDLGIAYLGTQGDIWDAQKDMFLAGLGSIITMIVTFVIIMTYNSRIYWDEIKKSFKVKGPELGEIALQKWSKK